MRQIYSITTIHSVDMVLGLSCQLVGLLTLPLYWRDWRYYSGYRIHYSHVLQKRWLVVFCHFRCSLVSISFTLFRPYWLYGRVKWYISYDTWVFYLNLLTSMFEFLTVLTANIMWGWSNLLLTLDLKVSYSAWVSNNVEGSYKRSVTLAMVISLFVSCLNLFEPMCIVID